MARISHPETLTQCWYYDQRCRWWICNLFNDISRWPEHYSYMYAHADSILVYCCGRPRLTFFFYLEKKSIGIVLRQFCPFSFSSIRAKSLEHSLIRGTPFRRLQPLSFVDYRKPVSSASFRQFRFVSSNTDTPVATVYSLQPPIIRRIYIRKTSHITMLYPYDTYRPWAQLYPPPPGYFCRPYFF